MTTTPTTGDPMTTTDHRRAARDLATDLAARGASLQGDRGVTGLRLALWRLANIVASIPAPQQPQESPEPAPEGDGTTDTASGREAGAQRDDHGWHTMPPGSFVIDGEDRSDRYQCRHDGTGVVHLRYKDDGPAGARRFKVGDRVRVRITDSDYSAVVIKADDGRFCRVRHDDDGHPATVHVSWLEPLPGPFDPPAVEPTPDWYRRTVEKWLDAPGHPDDRPARGELQWLLNRAEAGRPDLDDDHAFRPVAGHPDDDECTHRADGTDGTYCGQPEATHESGRRA